VSECNGVRAKTFSAPDTADRLSTLLPPQGSWTRLLIETGVVLTSFLAVMLTFCVILPEVRDLSRLVADQRMEDRIRRSQEVEGARRLEEIRKRNAVLEATLLLRQEENLKLAEKLGKVLTGGER